MFNVGVIGAGYVGLVTAACLAEMGNKVICVDNDLKKITGLKKGKIPIYESGLSELIKRNVNSGKLVFGSSVKEATVKSTIIFICVSTPTRADGNVDMTYVAKVAEEIAGAMNGGYKIIVGKSTVPAQTGERVRQTLELRRKSKRMDFDVVSNPEFLSEGNAVHDSLHPNRIVIGVSSKRAEKIMRELYGPFKVPLVVTNIATAEIIKHACNCFLASKISYINLIARLCEKIGADVAKVAEGMGLDKRIGNQFLNAGAGFGGNCFPKDLDAFIHLLDSNGCDADLLKSVRKINQEQGNLIVKKIEDTLWTLKGKTICVFGLSFKPETDDVRNSISLSVIRSLLALEAQIKAYDPQANEKARIEMGKEIKICKNAYEAAKKSDCIVLMTEWKEFSELNLVKLKKVMTQPVMIDGRNMFDPAAMNKIAFKYISVGRPVKNNLNE
jgi:UDPglucose 6-dehydrogenase